MQSLYFLSNFLNFLFTCTSKSSNLYTCILLPGLYILEGMCICYSVGQNSIRDDGARAVADGMKYCTSLQSLQ